MSTQPKISVIIPVYNTAEYLEECLDSVIKQTLKDIEIIIVNDCSTDNSLEIINSYAIKDIRIIIVNNCKNIGLAATRNVGLKKARGEYTHFLDSDDYIATDTYKKLYSYASNYNLDLLCFAYARLENNKNFPKLFSSKLTNSNKKIFTSVIDKQFLLIAKLGVTAWNKLYKTSFLIDNHLEFKESLLYEDSPMFWSTIIKAKNISYFNEALYFYRQRATSIMHSTRNQKMFDIIKVMDLVYQDLKVSSNLDLYSKVFVPKLIKTYLDFLRKIAGPYKKEFYFLVQHSLKQMDFTTSPINCLAKIKLTLLKKLPFSIVRIWSSLKFLH